MTAIRTLVFGVVAWSVLESSAAAGPMFWFGSQGELFAWYANQVNSAGNIYEPSSTDTVSNLSESWLSSASSSTATAPATMSAAPISAGEIGARGVPASEVAEIDRASGSTRVAEGGLTTFAAPNRPDAYLNFGTGAYAEASTLTVGSPGPWYNSNSVSKVFGGVPSGEQRADFIQSVLANVQHTFQISGMDLNLTDNPDEQAPRMLSVVSGASYGRNPDAVGITTVGHNGFSFIDKLSYASDPDELAWAVAHNVAHELMHALGVATHPDETGEYLDAAVAHWDMLIDPETKFSPSAVAMMQSATQGPGLGTLGLELLAESEHSHEAPGGAASQFLEAPVPEPSTIAVWTISGLFAGLTIRRRFARKEIV